mmetsp:Transcript_26189/g.26073  ORF Transcript_26189/g.26073 Transcript_26189/m.26073 type:complete len:114 (-) Transcript_26189:26-367(-)
MPRDVAITKPQRKLLSSAKTDRDLMGSNILHQVNHKESKSIHDSWKVPGKQERVNRYMTSSSVKDCLTLPTGSGDIEPKATIHGFAIPKQRDVWAPKAYRAHANAGNQRFYID